MDMDIRFPYSPAEVAKVRLVQFGILSPNEIRQISVVQIEHGETTEKGKPKVAGLSDPRLRTMDRKTKCETCMANMADCPGHFGYLELAKPMFHIGFMKTFMWRHDATFSNDDSFLSNARVNQLFNIYKMVE
nr:DNA-directed RNA polymerase II subunit 1 [Tanacetum cinerariifolium]GEY66400.1 DNA-directed RNA polymerase II subunit 1 [Tanacetum cinerariifolium]